MKISEIINESVNSESIIDSAETMMSVGWDHENDGEFVSYKKLEMLLTQIENIINTGNKHPLLSEAILELNFAVSTYLNAIGFNRLSQDHGAVQLKTKLEDLKSQAIDLYNKIN
jgi:hypothetical protein